MIKPKLTTVRVTPISGDFDINLVSPELMLVLTELQVQTLNLTFLKWKEYHNQI